MGAKVSKEEVQMVEGAAGAKTGLAIASQMELLKAKTFAIPLLLGGLAGLILPGKETDKKVKGAIKFVKESSMDKSTIVFNKMASAAGLAVMFGVGFAPKPRKTVTTMTNVKGENLPMKKLVNLPKKK